MENEFYNDIIKATYCYRYQQIIYTAAAHLIVLKYTWRPAVRETNYVTSINKNSVVRFNIII